MCEARRRGSGEGSGASRVSASRTRWQKEPAGCESHKPDNRGAEGLVAACVWKPDPRFSQ